MAFAVTIATAEAASLVRWRDEAAHVTDSPFADRIRQYLSGEHNFSVGDVPEPGCTAGYTVQRRHIADDFEMAMVLQNFPREAGLAATVYTHES